MNHANSDHLISYAGYRFPPEVISYAVWLYFRFPLSLRMVEEMLAARSIDVTYETVRRCWALKFGQQITKNIRHRPVAFGDKWHLDEVVVTINGRHWWLWRAVDQHGAVLDVLVQSRRNRQAAERLMRKLLRKHGKTPRVMVTDKLKSYAATNKKMGLKFEHRQHKGLNNRAENSYQPTRVREKIMRKFKSPRQLQRFVSVHDQVANIFQHCRYNRDAKQKRELRAQAFAAWNGVTCTQMVAR
nr:IS6 family transposase [Rhodoferax sp.]